MKRRVLFRATGSALLWPPVVPAEAAKISTIGVLMPDSTVSKKFWAIFREAMAKLGYVEGKDVLYERRVDDGPTSRLPELAAELVKRKVDVIVPLFTATALAAQQATKDIPIVMAGPGEPVASGLVDSLARPGGNISGTTSMASELGAKCLELLRQMLPDTKKVAVMVDATNSYSGPFIEKIRSAGESSGTAIVPMMINGYADIDAAFPAMDKDRPDSLIVQPSLPPRYVAELALNHKLPSASPFRAYAEAGGLMSYWVNENVFYRQTAAIVDNVLKGTKPADIPVETPAKLELLVNLKTAKALGLTVPPSILARADELIE
jgi:putative ABC transport system substrate-binding protein